MRSNSKSSGSTRYVALLLLAALVGVTQSDSFKGWIRGFTSAESETSAYRPVNDNAVYGADLFVTRNAWQKVPALRAQEDTITVRLVLQEDDRPAVRRLNLWTFPAYHDNNVIREVNCTSGRAEAVANDNGVSSVSVEVETVQKEPDGDYATYTRVNGVAYWKEPRVHNEREAFGSIHRKLVDDQLAGIIPLRVDTLKEAGKVFRQKYGHPCCVPARPQGHNPS